MLIMYYNGFTYKIELSINEVICKLGENLVYKRFQREVIGS